MWHAGRKNMGNEKSAKEREGGDERGREGEKAKEGVIK